jgi:hypothetical protein
MPIRSSSTASRSRLLGLAAAAALAAVAGACDARSTAPAGADVPSFGTTISAEIAQVRAATAQFQDVRVAVAAGYEPMGWCVSEPGVGGMGVHYLKYPLVLDAGFVPTEPEALLYEPRADGSLKLVAVEYIVVADAWHAAGNTGAPTFGGREFERGPLGPGMPELYTLHAWVWKPNPAGMFAPHNPRVSCPGGEHEQ